VVDTPISAKAALLQVLDTPGYGLELVERVRRETGGLVNLQLGSVYPALRALERGKLLRTYSGPRAAGAGRPRRYYELTAPGAAARTAQREALTTFFQGDGEKPLGVDVRLMRDRIRSCAQLSAFALSLRRMTLRVTRHGLP
jgi:PadR family transcriptional regulator